MHVTKVCVLSNYRNNFQGNTNSPLISTYKLSRHVYNGTIIKSIKQYIGSASVLKE